MKRTQVEDIKEMLRIIIEEVNETEMREQKEKLKEEN